MPKPSFEVSGEDGSYQCTLTLPPNAAFPRIVGPLCSTCNLAKQLVSLEACKKLHQLGELNDHLVVPIIEEPMDNDIALTYGKFISGPGMCITICNIAYVKNSLDKKLRTFLALLHHFICNY
jgi:endoribonuclease Dicer